MAGLADLFEPEEIFGAFWHRLVGEADVETRFDDDAVQLEDIRKRLEIFFRAVGGKAGVELKAIAPQVANYRQKFLAKLGQASTAVSRARFDGDYLFLPDEIALLPDRQANAEIYRWLAVWAACIGEKVPPAMDDPLQNDIVVLRFLRQVLADVFEQFPGMKKTYQRLALMLIEQRSVRSLPKDEAEIEAVIVAMLKGQEVSSSSDIARAIFNDDEPLDHFKAHKAYKTFLPIVLWGEVLAPTAREKGRKGSQEDAKSDDSQSGPPDGKTHKAKRQQSDQIDNKNSLILARFEGLLSWAEMMNIPRAVEDDEEDNAQRAADDQDELGLANIAKKASTKLKFDLDLAPQDVVHEQLSAKHTYPEWDYRKNIYQPDHCRVLAGDAPELEAGSTWQPDREARKRIRAVKRQFEALRPRQEKFLRQADGSELDMDALVRARCDMAASGQSSNRVFINSKNAARDLSVSVLIDTSRSSESWIEGKQVIEISREALMAMALGLAASGDDSAIYSFSSLKRERVNVLKVKDFDEPLSQRVFSRIGALKPGFYTRLGAAIRHVNTELANTASTKRLLLVISDGKPNDLDHYEGRYGVEDTAMAVREARRSGTAVFGLTIDKQAQSYFPYIFGRNAFAIANHARDLTHALPKIYRHLVM